MKKSDPVALGRSEALGRRRLALDALVEQYAIRDGDYARRLDALEAEAASTAARVSAEVKDSDVTLEKIEIFLQMVKVGKTTLELEDSGSY